MTSELPPEAHHYRRSQTPESPRPLHVPEPSNIPVLQNQMDPVFNDTTTYEIAPNDSSVSKISDATHPDHHAQDLPTQMTGTPAQPEGCSEEQNHKEVQNSGPSNIVLNGTTENEAISTNSDAHSSNATAPDLQRTLDSLAHLNKSFMAIGNANANANAELEQTPFGGEALTENLALSAKELSDTNSHAQSDTAVRPKSPDAVSKEGVNYQTLLDNLSQSTSTAPIAGTLTAPTALSTNEDTSVSQSGPERSLPVGAGLPPRPPPQEKPAIHPNYSPNESLRSYHQLPPQNVHSVTYQSQAASHRPKAAVGAGSIIPPPQPGARAANGLPPPPIATFQQPSANASLVQSPSVQSARDDGDAGDAGDAGGGTIQSPSQGLESQGIDDGEEEQPWGQDTQKKYDDFLREERMYVTEGVWDRFPPGSRLFVGNLPTEKVTKRDLFHIFHKHGKLAQISLKQAFGFVQFLEASSCYTALSKEQSVAIRGRKIHLEISKPQKGSRNSGPADIKSLPRRRSRSPERRRSGNDRGASFERLPFSDFRDEPARRRDDHRPQRSPSPRRFRSRDEYRVRERSPFSLSHYNRPRSPLYGGQERRNRSPSPRGFDDEAALPLPRRDPRDVPDVQILILEDIDQNFSRYIENAFKHKGLRAATIHLNPRITLAALVKRQIIEGVQAVVKLTRDTQYTNRIPLQVFDRGTGATSVNFLEYVDLDASIAADIVIQARQKERMSLPPAAVSPRAQSYRASHQPYSYPPPLAQFYNQPFSPPYQSAQDPSMSGFPASREASYGGPIHSPNSGGQSLQNLLANLRQTPPNQVQHQHLTNASGAAPDLGALLSNVARQQNQSQAFSTQHYAQQPSNNQFPPRAPAQPYTNPTGMSSFAGGPGAGPSQQPPAQNVQHIMDQLAKWRQ